MSYPPSTNVAIGYPMMQADPLYYPPSTQYPSMPFQSYPPTNYFAPAIEANAASYQNEEKTKKGVLGHCKTALLDVVSKKKPRTFGNGTHRVFRDRFVGATSPIWFPLMVVGHVFSHVHVIVISC